MTYSKSPKLPSLKVRYSHSFGEKNVTRQSPEADSKHKEVVPDKAFSVPRKHMIVRNRYQNSTKQCCSIFLIMLSILHTSFKS
jgi:hypothetical protein